MKNPSTRQRKRWRTISLKKSDGVMRWFVFLVFFFVQVKVKAELLAKPKGCVDKNARSLELSGVCALSNSSQGEKIETIRVQYKSKLVAELTLKPGGVALFSWAGSGGSFKLKPVQGELFLRFLPDTRESLSIESDFFVLKPKPSGAGDAGVLVSSSGEATRATSLWGDLELSRSEDTKAMPLFTRFEFQGWSAKKGDVRGVVSLLSPNDLNEILSPLGTVYPDRREALSTSYKESVIQESNRLQQLVTQDQLTRRAQELAKRKIAKEREQKDLELRKMFRRSYAR